MEEFPVFRSPFPVEVGIGIAIENNSGMFIIGAFPGLTFRTGNGKPSVLHSHSGRFMIYM